MDGMHEIARRSREVVIHRVFVPFLRLSHVSTLATFDMLFTSLSSTAETVTYFPSNFWSAGPCLVEIQSRYSSSAVESFVTPSRETRLHARIKRSALRLVHSTWTELQFANSVNSRIEVHVLRTNRALTVLISLQPINTKYSCRITGSTCSGQFSSVQFVCCEQAFSTFVTI